MSEYQKTYTFFIDLSSLNHIFFGGGIPIHRLEIFHRDHVDCFSNTPVSFISLFISQINCHCNLTSELHAKFNLLFLKHQCQLVILTVCESPQPHISNVMNYPLNMLRLLTVCTSAYMPLLIIMFVYTVNGPSLGMYKHVQKKGKTHWGTSHWLGSDSKPRPSHQHEHPAARIIKSVMERSIQVQN